MENSLVDELYKIIEAKDKIINIQALEIAKLKDDKKRAREYIKNEANRFYCKEDYELLKILGDDKNAN